MTVPMLQLTPYQREVAEMIYRRLLFYATQNNGRTFCVECDSCGKTSNVDKDMLRFEDLCNLAMQAEGRKSGAN